MSSLDIQSELCRQEEIAPTMYYRWPKTFPEAGKNGLTRDTPRDATSEEVRGLKKEETLARRRIANTQPQGPEGKTVP